MQTYIDIKH